MIRHAALLLALLSTPALAAPATMRATLAAPLAAPRLLTGTVRQWNCAGAVCIGAAENGRLGDARACRELTRELGPVTAFTGLRGELSPAELEKCNKAARQGG